MDWWLCIIIFLVAVVLSIRRAVTSYASIPGFAEVPHLHNPFPPTGVCSVQGRRQYMEDTFSIDCRQGVVLASVFDGHGGPEASTILQNVLHECLLRDMDALTGNCRKILIDCFRHVEQMIQERSSLLGWIDGSTGVCTCLLPNESKLWVANVGDSRAVMGIRTNDGVFSMPLSKDHKASDPEEKQRIVDKGGSVVHLGTWRVEGVLAVTRAFGDRHLNDYVDAEPEITAFDVDLSREGIVIVASDGIWDVMTSEQAVKIVLDEDYTKFPHLAAKKLVLEAYQRGSSDNITAIVIDLKSCIQYCS